MTQVTTKLTLDDILVVMALSSESQGRIDSMLPVLYTGVGKVNAAIALTRAIVSRTLQGKPPKLIINLGTVGSHAFEQFSLLNIRQFIQHDMDAVAFGYQAYQTPNEPIIALENGLSVTDLGMPPLPNATLYTGDQFIDHVQKSFTSVDMEGYALAKVCQILGAPFLCVKCVSDGAQGAAALSWELAVERCSLELSNWLAQFLKMHLQNQTTI